MRIIKSAKKRVKVTATKTLKNKIAKSQLRTALKKAALEINENQSAEALQNAYTVLDRAVAKGILHKNTAARKKAALAAAYNAAVAE